MVEKIADLYLPNSVVARLIKDAIPEGISIGKEARLAIAKAASIFSKYKKNRFRGNCAEVKLCSSNGLSVLHSFLSRSQLYI